MQQNTYEMELSVLEKQIPIKSIPEETLNRIILGPFLSWVSRLLSITSKEGAEKLAVALPAIKEHCWSMGFAEIKKMLEMYVDGKLNIEPIPNHFDRIQLGKIANAYRKQKPRKKVEVQEIEIPEEEKERLTISGISNCFEIFKQTGKIEPGYLWIYTHLWELGLFPEHTPEFHKRITKRAEERFTRDKSVVSDYQKAKEMIQNKGDKINLICKEIVMEDYFKSLIDENINILEKI